MRKFADAIRGKISGAYVILLASDCDGKAGFIVSATKEAVSAGIHAGNIVKEAARVAGGGGGGKPDSAQAGGKDVSKIPQAVEMAETVIRQQIKA